MRTGDRHKYSNTYIFNNLKTSLRKNIYMIIGMLNQKGGVGKTTLSISLAHGLSDGSRVLVLDADPQKSAIHWSEARQESLQLSFTIMGLPSKSIHRAIEDIKNNYDYIIIDGPPRTTEIVRSCIISSDLILIPCTPSPYDIWASQEIINLIKEAEVFKPDLKYSFVINRKGVNTAIGRDAVNILKDLNVPILESHICHRVAFAEAAAQGKTVFETDPQGKATIEIYDLIQEIEEKYEPKES